MGIDRACPDICGGGDWEAAIYGGQHWSLSCVFLQEQLHWVVLVLSSCSISVGDSTAGGRAGVRSWLCVLPFCMHFTFPSSVSAPPSRHPGKWITASPSLKPHVCCQHQSLHSLSTCHSLRRDVCFLPKYGKLVAVPSTWGCCDKALPAGSSALSLLFPSHPYPSNWETAILCYTIWRNLGVWKGFMSLNTFKIICKL